MTKIIFFGTPDYVLPILETLQKAFRQKSGESTIAAVVTQKPKPVGRKKKVTFSPIDKWAHKRKIDIFYNPEDLLNKNINADLGILASYGEIVPEKVIKLFPKGIINIHPSLLPKYRGASPIQAEIILEKGQVGVSFIKLDNKLDHGQILSFFNEEIEKDDTAFSLRKGLFEKSGEVLVPLLEAYLKGKVKLKEQDHESATYTRVLKKADAFIPGHFLNAAIEGEVLKKKWNIGFIRTCQIGPSAQNIEKFIRAMSPWPIAWSEIMIDKKTKKRIKIIKASLKGNKLILEAVQLEGKNEVTWKQFNEGYKTATFL